MGHNSRREANTRRGGVLRKSVAQLAVLGLVAGGAIFAFSAAAGAGGHRFRRTAAPRTTRIHNR